MSAVPAMPRQSLQRFPSLVHQRKVPAQPKELPQKANYKIHLIRDRGVRDHNQQKNIKELSKEETAIYRNSLKNNICIEMLRKGYHKSFSEVYTVIQRWDALRDAAGPGSAIWHQKPLEEQQEKLDQLQHFLTRAEAAQRAGYYEEVYENQLALAQYFQEVGDDWLSYHFFECCFQTATKIKMDGGRKEAEAHSNIGSVEEEHGQLEKAAEHYEAFYHLTVGRIWKDETGRSHNSLACENLWRIYTLQSDKMLANKECQQAIKTLIKAFDMAREGGNKKLEGEAAYRLGLAHISSGNPQTAITYLNTYMEISKMLEDNVSLGKAYKAMAKALESQGKILESVEYLENFIKIAKLNNLNQSLAETYSCLGDIFNTRGNYEKACQYFSKAYETALSLSELALIEEAQVQYGIAKAHEMMLTVSKLTDSADCASVGHLLTWKMNRSDIFGDPAKPDKLISMQDTKDGDKSIAIMETPDIPENETSTEPVTAS
ncbi:hypothetical protein XENTR_v10000739 [Xenopus tropicalis]|uniref:Tetratricopeptide repeat protein 29 n=1 Tax=Xenopus tropicalis TaxID=8364 RepID=F7AXU8_XENTR|nr:tetratricopeptide repeat protein 29 [Xenopus tropicalis]XP_031751365.1 tetratricopeptide repeat protein 29 [Xenopus tropicalis]KAE8630224.1 hypothetical protein XENTR_v10000739 [Xenopus tropicalis]|eukprot:XP_002938976.1 PREDICTED: tetratricopeptide repeat protein 29 [Xenopus tropicalis]